MKTKALLFIAVTDNHQFMPFMVNDNEDALEYAENAFYGVASIVTKEELIQMRNRINKTLKELKGQ